MRSRACTSTTIAASCKNAVVGSAEGNQGLALSLSLALLGCATEAAPPPSASATAAPTTAGSATAPAPPSSVAPPAASPSARALEKGPIAKLHDDVREHPQKYKEKIVRVELEGEYVSTAIRNHGSGEHPRHTFHDVTLRDPGAGESGTIVCPMSETPPRGLAPGDRVTMRAQPSLGGSPALLLLDCRVTKKP